MNSEVLVITGPESSGKTTLANQLAGYCQIPLAQEIAREYLANKPTYLQQDLLEIARQQQKTELALLAISPERIVCDTDLLVIIIWSEVKYGSCDPWIVTRFEKTIQEKLIRRKYFLCDYNIPWQDDPLRENPHNRAELFDLYLKKLNHYELNFQIVRGGPQQRLNQVVSSLGDSE